MKNLTFCFLLITFAFSSCRKGEDDPWLSLLSRKARLAGEWKLTKKEHMEKSTYMNGDIMVVSVLCDGEQSVATSNFYHGSEVMTNQYDPQEYRLQYEFDKKGYYKSVESMEDLILTEEGSWSFIGKNKGKKLKNKEAVILVALHQEQHIPSLDSHYSVDMEDQQGKVFSIRQLKNKKLVIVSEGTISHPNGKQEYSTVMTFSQQ